MATCNFGQPNLSKIYAIGIEEELDEFQYDDAVEWVQECLSKVKGKDLDHGVSDKWLGDARTVYAFGVNVYDKYYKGWEYVNLYVTIESGYYQGAMFDIDRSEVDDIEPSKTVLARIDRLQNQIERILEKCTTPIVRVATFSNGEAIYERASSKRAQIKAIVNG